MEVPTTARLRAGLALAACGAAAWWSLLGGHRVPLLALADLGFHELGHLACYFLPVGELLTALAGSFLQVAVPVGLAAYFAVRRDLPAAATGLAWAATSARDVAVYVADAPYQRLELIGGEHDWAYILGPAQLDRIDQAGAWADAVRASAWLLLVAGAALAVVALLRARAPAPLSGPLPRLVPPPAGAGDHRDLLPRRPTGPR